MREEVMGTIGNDRELIDYLAVGMLSHLYEVHLPPTLLPCGAVLTRSAAADSNWNVVWYLEFLCTRSQRWFFDICRSREQSIHYESCCPETSSDLFVEKIQG